jgi:hypothetical protein
MRAKSSNARSPVRRSRSGSPARSCCEARVLAQGQPVAGASVSRFPRRRGHRPLRQRLSRRARWLAGGGDDHRRRGPFRVGVQRRRASVDPRRRSRLRTVRARAARSGGVDPRSSSRSSAAAPSKASFCSPAAPTPKARSLGLSRGDGFGRSYRAGPAGRYRFEGLTPGSWQVLQLDREVDPQTGGTVRTRESEPIEWSCEVSDGRTTRFDLDLSRP